MQKEIIFTIGDLRKATAQFDDKDQVVLATVEFDTGDDIDTFDFCIEEWPGVKMKDGSTITEVRFVQQFSPEQKG
jgi:hypothetical protein